MLADRFASALARLQSDAAARQAGCAARDAFIELHFPILDAAFTGMIDAVTGNHPTLGVHKVVVTETFTNRAFTSLHMTVVEVRSTLFGPLERVGFTPALESLYPSQFGVIRVELEGMRSSASRTEPLFESILATGIVMHGDGVARLGVWTGEKYEALTSALLEEFLASRFIRTS